MQRHHVYQSNHVCPMHCSPIKMVFMQTQFILYKDILISVKLQSFQIGCVHEKKKLNSFNHATILCQSFVVSSNHRWQQTYGVGRPFSCVGILSCAVLEWGHNTGLVNERFQVCDAKFMLLFPWARKFTADIASVRYPAVWWGFDDLGFSYSVCW